MRVCRAVGKRACVMCLLSLVRSMWVSAGARTHAGTHVAVSQTLTHDHPPQPYVRTVPHPSPPLPSPPLPSYLIGLLPAATGGQALLAQAAACGRLERGLPAAGAARAAVQGEVGGEGGGRGGARHPRGRVVHIHVAVARKDGVDGGYACSACVRT